ncbi:MAG: hypothetical protein ACLRFI_01900 [Alphaproteobacteria bacterium]
MIRNKFLYAFCLVLFGIANANAADDYGCSDDDTYINPVLALCSTHAYNIGHETNPEIYGDKNLMEEVIALKTTIITQQMYKNYSSLESMMKRLKVQLEKAVLSSNLKAAQAASDRAEEENDTTVSAQDRRNGIFVSGMKSCSDEFEAERKLTCLTNNYTEIKNQSKQGNKQTNALNKQVKQWFVDMKSLESLVVPNVQDTCGADAQNCKTYCYVGNNDVVKALGNSGSDSIVVNSGVLNTMNLCIAKVTAEIQDRNNQNNRMNRYPY